MAAVSKHRESIFLAVAFDGLPLQHSVKVDIAIKLLATDVLTLPKAARFSGLSQEALIEVLGSIGIPAVQHDPAELDHSLPLPDLVISNYTVSSSAKYAFCLLPLRR